MKSLKRLSLFLLLLVSFVMADVDFYYPELFEIVENASGLSLNLSENSKTQSVVSKLETAPVAYYGTLSQFRVYTEETLESEGIIESYPQLAKSFVGWKNAKQKRLELNFSEAPEIYRKTYDLIESSNYIKGYVLLRYIVDVEKVYDKASRTWIKPAPENSKKSIFTMAYLGTDIVKDSAGWRLVQRFLTKPSPRAFWQHESPRKRIFFLDGFSETCGLFDDYSLGKVRYYPYRLKLDLEPNYAIAVRERMEKLVAAGEYSRAAQMADSADLSKRSNVLMNVLNRNYDFILNGDSIASYLTDYNRLNYGDRLDSALNDEVLYRYVDGSYCASLQKLSARDSAEVCQIVKRIALKKPPKNWSQKKFDRANAFKFTAAFDKGPFFLTGKFPDIKPSSYGDYGFSVYDNKMIFGFDVSSMSFDAQCDSCGTGDFGIGLILGYAWLNTEYIEGAVFSNWGVGIYEAAPKRETPKGVYQHEGYFRFGIGAYFDFLTPDLIRDPENSSFESRLGLSLRFGVNNIKVKNIGRADGYAPYIALGLVWHAVAK